MSACAGSGSSGFDAKAKAEQSAIAKVGEEGGCVDVEGTVICAPGANLSTALNSDVAFPLSESAASLSIEPVSEAIVSCSADPDSEKCQFVVRVLPSDFPAGTQFFVSTHFEDTLSWSNPVVLSLAASPGSALTGVITLETASTPSSTNLQIAVLVYGKDDLLPENQGEVPLLSDFFPELVYVVGKLKVEIVVLP